MCGIAGAFGFTNDEIMSEMLDDLVHRGPDEGGSYIDDADAVMMGTRRLSIVDIEGGSQPIWNEDETVCVTFNGEIYNHATLREELRDSGHRFSSRCDTEVLVHLWEEHGEEMVHEIEGMFGFAIWDSERERVFLARDRLGIKPLYYTELPEGVAWASELPTLFEAGADREISKTAINEYLSLSYVNAPRTVIDSIYKLPAGSRATIDESGISVEKYWTLSPSPTDKRVDSVVRDVRSSLEAAVEKRLMADVPVGAFLSGGLDSSSIVGLMSDKTADEVNTYSIEFATERYDETEFATTVASHFETDHRTISTDLSDLNIFEVAVANMNEPMPDPAILPTGLLSREASRDVKVVQTGSGGDEIFSGYEMWNMIGKHRRRFGRLPSGIFSLAGSLSDVSPIHADYLHYFSSLVDDSTAITNFYMGEFFTRNERATDWLTVTGDDIETSPEDLVGRVLSGARTDPAEQIYEYLIVGQLPSRLLHKVDTASMNSSLEARVPFLDRQLVETATAIPQRLKTEGDYKPILRKAVEDFVPSTVLERNKMGFSVPVPEWIESRRDPIERWLSEETLDATPYVDTGTVRAAYSEHYRGAASHSRMLFRILVYVAWYHEVVRSN